MFWYECKKTLFRPTVLIWMTFLLISNGILYCLWNNSQGIDGKIYKDLQTLSDIQLEETDPSPEKDRILEERQALIDYPAYLENILESDVGTISIFSDSLMSLQETMIKSHYKEKNLSAGNHSKSTLSIERLQEYRLWIIPEIMFLLYLLIQIVQKDQDSHFSEYIQTLPKGSKSCYVTRLIAVLLTMSVFTLLLCLFMIGIGFFLYGVVDLNLPVQSVLNLQSICDPLSIGQFLIIWISSRILTVLVISMFFYGLCQLVKNVWLGIGIGCMLFGFFHALSLISEDIQNILNFLNLSVIFDPLNSYIHVRYWFAFNQVVFYPYLYGLSIVLVFVIVTCGYLGFISHLKWNKLQFHSLKIHKCHVLSFYEFKKIWIHQKGLLFLIAVLLFDIGWIWNIRTLSSTYDVQINEYIDTLGTLPSNDTLQQEAEYFQQLRVDLDKAGDPEQRQILQEELNGESGFELYRMRVENAKSLQKEKLIKEDQCRMFFGNDSFRQLSFLILVTLLMFIAYKIKKIDYQFGMQIYKKILPCHQGSFLSQWLNMGILGTLAILSINSLMILKNLQIYPAEIFFENVKNLMDISIPLDIPIWRYLLLQICIQTFIIWILSYLLLEIFDKSRHKTLCFLSLCIILAMPLLLDYLWIWNNSLWIVLFYPFESLFIFLITLIIMLIISLYMIHLRKKEVQS